MSIPRCVFAVAVGVMVAACGSGDEACTAVYDPCTSNSQCESNQCKLFQQDGIQVCTTTCTPGDNSTCPVDATGVNGICNNMGICKPAMANTCTR